MSLTHIFACVLDSQTTETSQGINTIHSLLCLTCPLCDKDYELIQKEARFVWFSDKDSLGAYLLTYMSTACLK